VRILHVVPSYLPAVRYGGTITSVHGLCRALAAAGHQVTVATTSVDGAGDSPVPHEAPVDVDGVAVRYYRSPALRRLYWSPGMRRALPGLVAGADVAHLHSIYLWPTWAAARAARRGGVPYVLTPHGMLEKQLVEKRSRAVKTAWLALVERANLERAAAVQFTSERERGEAARFGYRFAREAVIPNGVDLPEASGAGGGTVSPAVRDALADPRPYFLFLGRISWKKGLDRLLRALPAVPEARLLVAGNDDEGIWPGLEAQAAGGGVGGRVAAVGFAGAADKRLLFARALAVVVPSYSENFGNVVLEAMAEGCPVIATPEVGAAEIVASAGAGLVVDGGAAALGGALAALAGDPARRAALGARGREAAAALSWTAVARRMAALYASLAGAAAEPAR
jgi:glycosyltransferase involved in cell wall biosynthesis